MAVRNRMAAAAAVLVVATSGGTASAAEAGPSTPVAVFTFEAEDGAHPVDGRSGAWVSPDSEVRVWELENIVKIDAEDESGFDWIRVELNGPGGVPLAVGDYPDVRGPDTPGHPGMLVISGSFGCTDSYGEFTVDTLDRDAAGHLVALDADFTHRCGGPDEPALRGRIHFRS
jgi:hypothetical protein